MKKGEFKRLSTGMGLSICRIISKSLGGECGLETFVLEEDKYVRFWTAIKFNNIKNSMKEIIDIV